MINSLFIFLFFIITIIVYIIWDEQKQKSEINKRFSSAIKQEYIYEGRELSIFEKLDIAEAKRRHKKLKKRFEKPNILDILKVSLSFIFLYLSFKIHENAINLDNLQEIIIVSLSIFLFFVGVYFLVFLPSYYKIFEEHFPGNLRLFAQEISFSNNIRSALLHTGEYAHPEMSNVCVTIAKLNDLGLSMEKAVMRCLPAVKSQSMMMFLSVLIIHDSTGGRLAKVLQELSELFYKQYFLKTRLAKILIISKICLYFSVLYYPLIMLTFYVFKHNIFLLLIDDPVGWFWHKIVILLYIFGVLVCLFLLRNKSL